VFDHALTFVLKWEGGYVNHPQDPGGATNLGITQRTYDAWRQAQGLAPRDVRQITREEAAQIYRQRYWEPLKLQDANPALQLAAFDAAVNHGVGQALTFLARCEGDWRRLIALRITFYTNLRIFDTFGRGWMRRMADLLHACIAIDAPPRLMLNGVHVGAVRKMSYVGNTLWINQPAVVGEQ
jgi:lysozyme family protein